LVLNFLWNPHEGALNNKMFMYSNSGGWAIKTTVEAGARLFPQPCPVSHKSEPGNTNPSYKMPALTFAERKSKPKLNKP